VARASPPSDLAGFEQAVHGPLRDAGEACADLDRNRLQREHGKLTTAALDELEDCATPRAAHGIQPRLATSRRFCRDLGLEEGRGGGTWGTAWPGVAHFEYNDASAVADVSTRKRGCEHVQGADSARLAEQALNRTFTVNMFIMLILHAVNASVTRRGEKLYDNDGMANGNGTMTARQMVPALGAQVDVRCESLTIACTVADVRWVYGEPQLLVRPSAGTGEAWVKMSRLVASSVAVAVR